jgi:hypothetical protein
VVDRHRRAGTDDPHDLDALAPVHRQDDAPDARAAEMQQRRVDVGEAPRDLA